METNTILIIGFLAVLFLLWQILKELIDINLRSEQTSKHLFEIKLDDLSGIKDHLEKINDKLESIESLVDVIKDEKLNKEA